MNIIKILLCGLCVREERPSSQQFRTSDNEVGETRMRSHIRAAHGIEVGEPRSGT